MAAKDVSSPAATGLQQLKRSKQQQQFRQRLQRCFYQCISKQYYIPILLIWLIIYIVHTVIGSHDKISMNVHPQYTVSSTYPPNPEMDDDKIHIVFSTGCNAFQDCKFPFFRFVSSSLFDVVFNRIQTLL
jgi:hypothetical protein